MPRFVTRFHVAGLISEDPCESIHAFTNNLARCLRNSGRDIKAEEVLLNRVAVLQDKIASAANAAIDNKRKRGS